MVARDEKLETQSLQADRMSPERQCACLFLLLAIGLLLQYRGLHNNLMETIHAWRQTHTAMVSRNFYRDGMNPLVARVDHMGDGQTQLELPIYTYSVAVLYTLFGLDEIYGRIVSIVFGMGTATLLFLLGRMLWNPRVGLLAAAVFSWAPLNVFFNRAFMPDASTVFFLVLSLWAFTRYCAGAANSLTAADRAAPGDRAAPSAHGATSAPRPSSGSSLNSADCFLWLGGLGLACGLAGKPPLFPTVAIPLITVVLLRYGRTWWRQRRLMISVAAAAAVYIAWAAYSSYVNHHLSDNLGIEFFNAGHLDRDLIEWYVGTWQDRVTADTYLRFAYRIPEYVGHWSVLLLVLLGLIRRPTSRLQWLLPAWAAGCLLYLFICLRVNYVHNYYQLAVIPMLALAAGAGVDWCLFLLPLPLRERAGVRVTRTDAAIRNSDDEAPTSTNKAQAQSELLPLPLESVGKSRGTGFQPVFSASEHGQDARATSPLRGFPTNSLTEMAGVRVTRTGAAAGKANSIAAATLAILFCIHQIYRADQVMRDFDPDTLQWSLNSRAYWDTEKHKWRRDLGRAIHEHLPDNGGLIAIAGERATREAGDPAMMYYVDRRGFILQAPDAVIRAARDMRLDPETQEAYKNAWVRDHFPELLDRALKKNVRTLILVRPTSILSPTELDYLTRPFRLHYAKSNGDFAIFDLAKNR